MTTATATASKNVGTYAEEHIVRRDIAELVDDHRFTIDSYGITDKGNERTLSIAMIGMTGDERPTIFKAIALELGKHGYLLDSAKVSLKAIKDTAQISLPL